MVEDRWSVERVEALAPDAQVAGAARMLASPAAWRDVGTTGSLVWGTCHGSGSTPHRASIDLAGPLHQCSCPSQKRPCRHVLALLLLWAQGMVGETGLVEANGARTTGPGAARGRRARASTGRSGARVVGEHAARIDEGVAELELFLMDQVRQGLATHPRDRPTQLKRLAARMVDAHAPGLAAPLRDLATVRDSDPDWPARLTEGYARLHLLARAWQQRDGLPDDFVATIRSHLGFTPTTDEVLALPGVHDRWTVFGMRDHEVERTTMRHVWLRGHATGRFALVVSTAARGKDLDVPLALGTVVDAVAHFHPGRPVLQATLAPGHREVGPSPAGPQASAATQATTVAAARAEFVRAVTLDPWLEVWPVAVHGAVHPTDDGATALVDGTGSLPLLGSWRRRSEVLLRAPADGVTVLGELSSAGLWPHALVLEGLVLEGLGFERRVEVLR